MKRILITRPRAQADDFAEKLRTAGFEPIFFPVIEIRPIEENVALERALAKLDCYDWVVFTSVNAVKAVLSLTPGPPPIGREGRMKIAAIGPKTAEALQARGVTPDFVPAEYVAEAILPGMGDLRGKWILLPRAEIARKALPEAISKAGGVPHEIAVYRTVPVQPDPEGLAALRSGVDWITFTSPSTVEHFAAIVRRHGLDPLNLPGEPGIACIGPITEQAACAEGFQVALMAKEYTTDGLIHEISSQVVK